MTLPIGSVPNYSVGYSLTKVAVVVGMGHAFKRTCAVRVTAGDSADPLASITEQPHPRSIFTP